MIIIVIICEDLLNHVIPLCWLMGIPMMGSYSNRD